MKEIDLITRHIDRFIEKRRPPAEIRDRLDLGYTYENQIVEIFEIRPQFMDESKMLHIPVAKGRYVKSKGTWKVYWMRSNGKWVTYDPQPEVKTIDEFLNVVDQDAAACFFG